MIPLAAAFGYLVTATTIVAIWTPSGVVIGADGKAIRGGDLAEPETTCKIHVQNGIAFAFTDFVGSPYSGFFAEGYATKALSGAEPFERKVIEFERTVSEPLSEAVNTIRTTNPQGYERDFRGKSLLQVVFAAFDGDTPKMKYIRFDIEETQTAVRATITLRCEFPSGSDVPTVWALGRNSAISAYLKANSSFYDAALRDPKKAIQMLIELEIKAEPDWVGYPMSVVQVSKDGPIWLERPPECR
ncbi:MAG: hypothetical protein LAP13_15675 [Acidobacteriia bacterium]|nr:hypothetical protein [Terriglobia bacterium]